MVTLHDLLGLTRDWKHLLTVLVIVAAPFQWAAIFHKTDINFSRGHHNLEWYDPTDKDISHRVPCKVRCNYCHSPIMDEGRNMILLFPSLIHLKTDEAKLKFRPRCHMFYNQRVIDIPDGYASDVIALPIITS